LSHPAPKTENSLTTMLQAWQASRQGIEAVAFNTLIEACYEQLRRIAAMRVRERGAVCGAARSAISVSPSELLHDAIICIGESGAELKNSQHFLATMSLKMRSLLVDHARGNLAERRGGDWLRVTFTDFNLAPTAASYELIAIDDALSELDSAEPRVAQVMHLSYFADMKRDDIAKLLNISSASVDRDLRFGRAFTMDKVQTR
jgi:RNA polymerase sigma factor (TIGR02999 family)